LTALRHTAINYIKETVFGVDQGKAIIVPFHPAMADLHSQPKGDCIVLVTTSLSDAWLVQATPPS